MLRRGDLVRHAIAIVVWLGVWAAVGAGSEWLWPRERDPDLVYGALFGMLLGLGTAGVMYADRRGWISGFLFDDRAREAQRQKKKQLARNREKIMQDARAKLN